MKKAIVFSALTFFICLNLIGQSSTFNQRVMFNEINGIPTPYPAFMQLIINSPDIANSGQCLLWKGEPNASTMQYWVFKNIQNGITSDEYSVGQFYVTESSSTPLSIEMNYGYHDQEDDRRFAFDKVTYTTGRYMETEGPELTLTREDVSYDCNIVDQNCRVFQRHRFTIPRDKAFSSSTDYYDHVNILTIRYYKDGKIAHTLTLPYVVQAKVTEYLSTGPGPYELLNIIRAVPGDHSKAFMSKETSTRSEVKIGAQKSDSQSNKLSVSLSASFSIGPIGGTVEANASQSITNTAVQGKENTYLQEFVAKETYSNDNSVGDKTDLFIVALRKYDFGMEYDIKAQNINGLTSVSAGMKMIFWPLDVIKTYAYTEKQLINDIIPNHLTLNEKGKADYWKLLLHKNDSIKKAVKLQLHDKSFAAPISGPYDYETEYTRSASLTLSQEISIEKTESIGLKVGGSNATMKGEKSWVVSTTSSGSKTNGQSDKIKTGYTIFDQNYLKKDYRGGDKLHLKLWTDPTTGTAIWDLDEVLSTTSCPYEGGYQSDQPEISVSDPQNQQKVKTAMYANIPFKEKRTFLIKISNNNNKEIRAYDIRIPNTSSKPIVESPDDLTSAFVLDPGESRTIELTVKNKENGPKDYDDFQVIFGPECDPLVCDTVFLSASFVGDEIATKENDCIAEDGFYDNFNELTPPTDGSITMSYYGNESNKDAYSRSGTGDLVFNASLQNLSMGCSFSDAEKKNFVDVSANNQVQVALTNKGDSDIKVYFSFTTGNDDRTLVQASSNREIFVYSIAAGATMIKTFDLEDVNYYYSISPTETCPEYFTREGNNCFQKNSLFDPSELSKIKWQVDIGTQYFRKTNTGHPVAFHYIKGGRSCQQIDGTEDVSATTNFTVFPNPANDLLNVNLSNQGNFPCKVSLVDLNGREIFSSLIDKNNNSVVFSTSELNAGIYFVSFNDGKNVGVKKVIIN